MFRNFLGVLSQGRKFLEYLGKYNLANITKRPITHAGTRQKITAWLKNKRQNRI